MFIQNHILKLLKQIKEAYLRNWREQGDFEKFGGIIFGVAVILFSTLTSEETQKELSKYMNLAAMLFVVILYRKTRKSKRELIVKNKEIESQKKLIEEKQKEILDSITYAKRIQMTQMTSEKYIQEKIQQLTKRSP